ncbi:hypothetical protein [Thiohalorhabdus sp.]
MSVSTTPEWLMLPITDGIQIEPWLALLVPVLVIGALYLVSRLDR